jgi:hypothetical protein
MLRKRILTGCLGALAIGLSSIGAVAAPAAVHAPVLSAVNDRAPVIQVRGGGGGFGGGGGHGGSFGGGGFQGGGGFHGGGSGGGFHGGGFAGNTHGMNHGFRGHHRAVFFGGPFGYYDDYGGDCWWSARRDRWVCPGY